MKYLLIVIGFSLVFDKTFADYNKYSKELNQPLENEPDQNIFKTISRPFRINKLNIVWTKAQHVSNFGYCFEVISQKFHNYYRLHFLLSV